MRGRVLGEHCLMGRGFPFRAMKMFGNQIEVVVAHNTVNVLNCSLKNGYAL